MDTKDFFPNVLSVEHKSLPDKKSSVSVPQIAQISKAIFNIALKGVVSKEGKWLIDPGGFVIEHKDLGEYKIIHNLGYTNVSLSPSILEGPGTLVIKEHHPMYFVIEISLDKQPIDKDWCFTLMRTL